MNALTKTDHAADVADVLRAIKKKGVELWADGGKLHYKAPKGALSPLDLDKLRASRSQLIAHFERTGESAFLQTTGTARSDVLRVPMSFTQRAHFNLYQLDSRRAIRQIASATRLRGPVSIDALRHSIDELVRRHEALRTRVVIIDGEATQEIDQPSRCDLQMDDLREMPEAKRECAVLRILDELILEPIDIAAGPLFGTRLLQLRGDEYVLLVVMEHLISDAFSMNIFLRELFTAYSQIVQGRDVVLPEVPIQFREYIVRRHSHHAAWLAHHGSYWTQRLKGCCRIRFPGTGSVALSSNAGWDLVPVRIGSNLKSRLKESCRIKHTTMVVAVFTVYVALVLRWYDVTDAVIQYQTDGRGNREVEHTIGYFASVLFLRMTLYPEDSLDSLIGRVTDEYCNACDHADASYLEAQVPRPELARNPCFNWVPQGATNDMSHLELPEGPIACSQVPFEHPMLKILDRDNEPILLLFEGGSVIEGGIYFPLNLYPRGAMEEFARTFMVLLEALLTNSHTPLMQLPLT